MRSTSRARVNGRSRARASARVDFPDPGAPLISTRRVMLGTLGDGTGEPPPAHSAVPAPVMSAAWSGRSALRPTDVARSGRHLAPGPQPGVRAETAVSATCRAPVHVARCLIGSSAADSELSARFADDRWSVGREGYLGRLDERDDADSRAAAMVAHVVRLARSPPQG